MENSYLNKLKYGKKARKKHRKHISRCTNCGNVGHKKKNCKSPRISCGIICFSTKFSDANGNPITKLLIIKRKHSYAFIDFARGLYEPRNISTVKKLIVKMTDDERAFVLNNNFDSIWNNVWGITINTFGDSKHKKKYDLAKNKFKLVKSSLEELINDNPSKLSNGELFGFPKGRRDNIKVGVGEWRCEKDLECALREFHEETNYLVSDIVVLGDIKPHKVCFAGSDNKYYQYIYYIARFASKYMPSIFPFNEHQKKEIQSINWFTYKECMKIFENDSRKQRTIKKVFGIIENRY